MQKICLRAENRPVDSTIFLSDLGLLVSRFIFLFRGCITSSEVGERNVLPARSVRTTLLSLLSQCLRYPDLSPAEQAN